MSIAALLRTVPARVFDALSGVPEIVIYQYQAGAALYDIESGDVKRDPYERSVRAIFTNYSLKQIEMGAVQPFDRKCLIDAAELAAGSAIEFTPQVHDTVLRADACTWRVVSVMTDPAQALWVLQVRQP